MTLGRAVSVSVLAHGLIAAALLLQIPKRAPAQPQQLAQIELIQQPTPNVGDGQAETAPPPAPPPTPVTAADVPTTRQAALSPTAQPPTPQAVPEPARPVPQAAPAVRLGDSDTAGTALVSGDNIIPPSLGSAHNDPPPYPEAAAKRGEEGTVTLLVHIDPTGTPLTVDVQESSGYDLLDRAARQAVARWHFHPAQNNGIGVESDMPVRIRFVMKG